MGKNSNCIGAMKFEEKLVTILGTKELADAEARRIASDSFKKVFGDWKNNKDAKWTDKQGALRQDDNGYPRLFKSGNQFYYKLKNDKKDFLNKIKFPEIDPDDVFEVTDQLKYELFSTNEGFDFNNIENIKGLKIAESIQSSIDAFRAENVGDPDAQMRADLIEKYKEDFVIEVRTQIEDMGFTSSKRIKAGARKDQIVDLTDENGNPEGEIAEEDKSTGLNIGESYTKNSKDTASVNVKLLLSTVLDTKFEVRLNDDGSVFKDEDGDVIMDLKTIPGRFLGKPRFVKFDDVWTTLEPMLANLVNFNLGGDVQDVFDLMIEKLETLEDIKPWTVGLIMRLKELNTSEKIGERNKITEFFQAFSKAKLTYYVTEVNGRNIKIINASATNSRSSKIKSEWGRNFRKKFLTSKGKMNKATDIEQISDMITESKKKFVDQVGTRGTLESKMKSISENLPVLVGLMNSLGINVNNFDVNNFMFQVRDQEKVYGEVKALYEGMERTMALIKDDKVPFITAGEFKNPFDDQAVLLRLANARALSAIQLSENTIVGNEGKTYWTYSSLSYLHNKINSWKQQAGDDDTMDIQALASLTYNKNSRWLKYLLAADVVNDSEREAVSLQRIAEVEIVLSSSIKSKNKNDGVDNTKITIADAINDSMVKILGKKASAQKSLFPTIVPADKSRKMDIAGFEMFETGIVYTNGKGTEVDDATSDIFIDYFEDELNRMSEAADEIDNLPDSEKIEHYHTKSMNALKSQLFPEFSPAEASKEIKAILYDNNRPKKSTISGLSKTQREALRPFVVQAIKDRMKETLQELRKNKIIEVDLKEKGGLKALTIDKTLMASYESQSSPIHTMVGDYVVNGLISTIEYTKLFSGDPAYYKNQSDLIKRIPATYTDGLQLRLSENDHKYFNQATINGVEVASKFLDEIINSLKTRNKKGDPIIKKGSVIPGTDVNYPSKYYGLSEVNANIALAYDKIPGVNGGVNTTDAQAWITPHRWKFLKERLGQWGAQHEKVFKKMMDGKELDSNELKLAAQPLKGVYFEINDGRPVYLKYSQAVLVPSLVKNTPMQALYNKMTIDPATGEPFKNKKDEIHEVITRDGVKVGAKGITDIHSKDGELLAEFELNSTPLINSGWKLQQDLPTKLIHNTLTGSQIQKNILAGIDLSSKLANYEFNGEPKTGIEIMQMIHDTIGSLVGEGKESLKTKFGIGEDNKITNMTAVYDALIDEFKSRGGDENIISALEKEMPFDAIPQLAGRVQSIFMSIFNKELIKVKTNGGSFIQVSPFGLESVQEIVKKDNGKGPNKVLRSGIKIVSDNYDPKGLKPPRIDKKTGKVLPGQAMLPYSAIRSTIDKYNKQFKDENDPQRINPWNMSAAKLKEILDPSALQMVAYRIPNQGMSSNDPLEIVGILPPELGDSIIAYDAVPGKTGSDFDIDKMYVMTHHLEVRDGKIKKVPSNMDSKKGKQNMLVDLYTSVLTSPHTYDQMMTSIDAGLLKDDIVGLFPPEGLGNLQFMSPIQQIKTKLEYLSGKFGVAQTANQLVDHVSNQSLNIRLKGYLGIGHQDSKGRTKFDNIKDINGKNSISDVLSAFLNAYVDIAKDSYISRGNHNVHTAGITFMLIRAGAPISWVNRFIGQPILKDLVDVINMSDGKTSRRLTFGASGKTVTPMEYIRLQYGVKKGDANERDVAALSESKMETAIKKEGALTTEEKIEQGKILDVFEFLQDHARAFNAGVSAAKADTKGNGGGVMPLHIAKNKVNAVLNAKKILGYASKGFTDEYATSTMMGHYYHNGVLWVSDVLQASDLFLAGKQEVLHAFDSVSEALGKGLLTDPELGRLLENSFRSYSMSGLSVFKDNNSDHDYLFKVLPEQISALKETSNNFLIQELTIENSGGYEFLGIDSSAPTKSFNNRIYRAWSQLLNSSDPAEKKLGVDLIRYAFSQSGFNNNLNQFFSHIPHNFFAEQGIAFEIDEMFRNVDNMVAGEDFKDQMLRHQWDNKTLGSKLVPELRADKVKGFGGLFSLGTGFINDEEKNPINLEKNLSKPSVFPKFTKVMLNQKDVYDKGATPNYGLFILRGEVNGNPVYTRTHKLGHKSNKGSIFEYNEKNTPIKSVIEGNNVPTKIKGEIRQIMSQLRSDPGFIENKAGISIQESSPSENVREISTKILSNNDVAAFKKYVADAQGKLPAEFFTSDSVFAEIKDSKIGGKGKMPQDHIWIKNSEDRYDMVDQTNGEIVIANVDLETGLKYEDVNIDKVSETKVSVVDRYSVADLKANPDKIFVFGDNLRSTGKGGQAIIRDEENAFGIPTKKLPSRTSDAYYSDLSLEVNKTQIDGAIEKIKNDGRTVVFPKDGLGTGLAKLKEKAPQTFEYLNKRLKEEFGFNNTTGKLDKDQEERILPSDDYQFEDLQIFNAKIAHLQSKMNVEVIMDGTVPTSRVLGASDPRTIKAGKPVILINPKAIFKTTAIHEFAHIFIDAFPGGLKNKRLQKALQELKRTGLYDEVKEGYPELSDEMFEKELLATAIGREGSEIWDSKEKEGMWTAFKNWFFDFLRRAFGLNRSEVTNLTKELLNNTVNADLLANLSEQDQQEKNFGQQEKDEEVVELENTYNQIVSSISNLRQAIEPVDEKERKIEESKKAGLDKGEKTKYQEVKALDEKLTEEMEKLNETANSRAILRYVAFSQKSVNEYKALVSRLTERGKLTPEEIKNIKFFTSVFNMIPDVKQLMLEQYEKGYLKNNNGQKKKRMAVLDKIIADYDTLNQEMLGVSRRIYAQTMVENSNEHVMAWRDKFERQYAELEARNAKPDENIYEWVNAKMTANKDKIESEAFKFYEEQAKKSLSDIHASTGWLVSEKNIASAEIQTVSRMIDAADFEVDRWVQAQAKEVESAYEAFSKDYASSLGTEERNKKFVDQTDEGSYFISEYKADFLAKYYEANSWINRSVYEEKFSGIEVTKDGKYTINGETKSLVLPRNGFKVKGTHVFYTEAGITHSMTLEEAIGKSERAYWIEENTDTQKTSYGLDLKPKKSIWANPSYEKLSVKDRVHLKFMKDKILKIHELTDGKNSLIEKAGVADFYRLPGVTRSSIARALSGDLKSLVSDGVTDLFKKKEDEFEIESSEKGKGKIGGSINRVLGKDTIYKTADLTNKQTFDVPINLRAKLSKANQSLDIHTILVMALKDAKNYEQKKKLEATVDVFIDVMSNRLVPNHSGLQKLKVMHGFSKDKEIQMHLPKEKLPEDVKTLISIKENRLYGIKSKDAGEIAGVNMQKATSTLLKTAGSVALIGNFVNSFVNATTGTANNLIEAWGGETYNLTNWKNAGVKYWKDAKGLVGDMGSNTHSSKTNMMLDVFNVLGSRESLNNNFEDNSRLKSMLKTSKLRPIAQGGEHMMQSKVMYAVLDNIKVLNAKGEYLDKNGNVTKDVAKSATLDEVLYFEKDKKGEAHMKLPKWVAATTFSPQPGKQDDILVDARGLIKKKIIDLHGNYDNDLKNKAQREWWGKLLFFLKKWMESTTLRRWRGAATMLKKSEELRDVDRYYSEDMKQYQEGFYVTAARFIRNSLIPAAKELKFEILTADYKNLSKHEKANMRRLVAELGMITMTILAYAAMGGFDDDPDDDTLMARYYLRREMSELSFYLSPAETIKLMKNPTASISVIERYTKVLGQFLSPTERYEQGINEGRLKLWVKTKKALPYWAQTEKDYKASLRFLQVMD